MCSSSSPPEAPALQVGRDHDPADVPDVRSGVASSLPRTAPTSRPATRTTQSPSRRSHASTSSSDSCSAGMSSMSLASASCTQQARCRVRISPASPRTAGHDLPLPPDRRLGCSRSGRRSAVRRSACSARQAAIAAWSPESSTSGTSRPRQDGGPGVDGVLEQAVLVGLLDQRLGVAHEARQQPDHRLGDRQRGHLAAVEHVVAERDLDDLGPGGGVVEHALVDALVAPAREHQPLAAPARSRASAWVNGRPAGVGTTSVAPSMPSSSNASPHGSGLITMPAPPPYGVSSTVRCRSWVQVRRSWTCTSSRPWSRALPVSESPSGAR